MASKQTPAPEPGSLSTLPDWISADPALLPHDREIRRRHSLFRETLRSIERSDGSLRHFVLDHGLRYFGLQRAPSGWTFREWAPCASAASLVGDFNGWDVAAHPCELNDLGVWEAHVLDHAGGGPRRIGPGSKYKVALRYLGGGDASGGGAGVGIGVGGGGITLQAKGSGGRKSAATGAGGRGGCPLPTPPCAGGGASCGDGGACGAGRGFLPPSAGNTGGGNDRPRSEAGGWVFAVPAWAQQCTQDPISHETKAVVPSQPVEAYSWKHPRPPRPLSLRIYEVHPGIATAEEAIGTWRQLRITVLPHAHSLGYNALLLLGMQEHGFYPSFGYQVTSYFAASERFGPPTELQALVDQAHSLGMLIIGELVHGHAALSVSGTEGLPQTPHGGPYFKTGQAGHHAQWGSRLFDYTRTEVLRLLLANIFHWASNYRLDGFRFDAGASILYSHGGGGTGPGDAPRPREGPPPVLSSPAPPGDQGLPSVYCSYFGPGSAVDEGGLVYLQLATHLAREEVRPPLLTIVEEVTGYPGTCAPVSRLGLGFDMRMAMGLPDLWGSVLALHQAPVTTKLPIGRIAHVLTQSRLDERRLGYTECHDQSLVGDQALAFRLMGRFMYTHMALTSPPCDIVERGIALHKLSRLLTCASAADAYLNFVGNEFGHPEWIEMPSAANSGSLRLARRRWDLLSHPGLRYAQLARFDREMLALEAQLGWMRATPPARDNVGACEERQLLYFWRGAGLFVFNLHPSRHAEERIAVPPLDASSIPRGGTRRAHGAGKCWSAPQGAWRSEVVIPEKGSYIEPPVARLWGGAGPTKAEPGLNMEPGEGLNRAPRTGSCSAPGLGRHPENPEFGLELNSAPPRVRLNSDLVRLGGGGRSVLVQQDMGVGGSRGGARWLRVVIPPWTAAVVTMG